MSLKVIKALIILGIFTQEVLSQNSSISCVYDDPYNYNCNLMINNLEGSNDFKEITGQHQFNLTDINVQIIYSHQSIVSLNLPAIICEKFQNVTNIQLYYNEIQRIDSYSFKGCMELKNLNLYYNQISFIDEYAFANNYNLESLELSQNRISSLPENLFMNLVNLNSLNLNGNQIADMPKNIFNSLMNLTSLALGHNYMQKLRPEWFETLECLTHIEFYESNFTEEIPRNVFKSLKNLNYVGLSNSKIKVIHADTFGESLSIQNIQLGYNRIYAISEKFIDNTEVSYLGLHGNICADDGIDDFSMSRKNMRAALKDCFEFYQMLIEKNPLTNETSVATTENTPTTPSSWSEKIERIETELLNLTFANHEVMENWKSQYLATAENKEQIIMLQSQGTDLQHQVHELKDTIDEISAKIGGSVQNKDTVPHNGGNNFVSINIDNNYQKHESD